MAAPRAWKVAAGSALVVLFGGLLGEADATTAAKGLEVRIRDADKESTEDDDGYADVARAVLRQAPPSAEDEEDGAEMLSDRAFRAVVAQRVRAARAQHRVMKDFMTRFSRNLKLSVLEDSKGDMPEAERIAAIRALKEGKDIRLDDHQSAQEARSSPAVHRPQRRHHNPHRRAGGVQMLNGRRADLPPPAPRTPAVAELQGADQMEPKEEEAVAPRRSPRALLTELRRRQQVPQPVFEGEEAIDEEEAAPSPLGPASFGAAEAEETEETAPPRRWLAHQRPARRPPPLLFAEGANSGGMEAEGMERKPSRGWGNMWGADRTKREKSDEDDKDGAPRRSGLPLAFSGLAFVATMVAATAAAAA